MTDQRERRLLGLAAAFLALYSIVLTLSPAVREHTWAVTYRWSHWVGFIIWIAALFFAHRQIAAWLPDRDPYLLPLAAMLSGWGLLTVWRLEPGLGYRQSIWLAVSVAALLAVARYTPDLALLRRYKYVLLAAGLVLTALTMVLGSNPTGSGPRLWLGCCGFYLQPSEPLKLLLVAYLAAYLADRPSAHLRAFPMLAPTVLVTGVAFLLLVVQRDLGTASIFILLYAAMLFIATEKRWILLATAVALIAAGLLGFFFIDVVHARLESWFNPWNDPSGRSYQIIQSLLAVANGGAFGRGPGLGSPGLVPVAHSDFIFSAMSEETGLIGTIGLLIILAIVLARGMLASLRARERFHKLLAAGLTAYLGIQALLIIGGNLRLLPLTGITLPFVSYGGSSLLTSYLAMALLLTISNRPDEAPVIQQGSARPFWLLAGLFAVGLLAAGSASAWWAIFRSSDLLSRTDNPRRSIADRYVPRGALLDRNNRPINGNVGESGSYSRVYDYPALAPVVGYTHRVYGQAGLEAALDEYLRGVQGYPASQFFWESLLYGMPPPGLDVRLSVDLDLQAQADTLLGPLQGAVVLINAQTGEILAMASHPTYDPNQLDHIGASLPHDPGAPLVDRAAQGEYPIGTADSAFATALGLDAQPTQSDLVSLYEQLGFYTTPQVRMPVAPAMRPGTVDSLRVSPLQMVIAAAALSNGGVRPAPRIALAVDTPQQGWVILPALGKTGTAFSPDGAAKAANQLVAHNGAYWQWTGLAQSGPQFSTWFLAGTPPTWKATPFALVVLLEGNNPLAAQRVGQQLMETVIKP